MHHTMLIELHAIQNFAPANLNRDDTGTPKNCQFGGVRRARVSSQSLKRAMRDAFRSRHLLDDALIGTRTKRLVEWVVAGLIDHMPEEEAKAIAKVAVSSVVPKMEKEVYTSYLVFVSNAQVKEIVAQCLAARENAADSESAAKGRRGQKEGTNAATDALKKGVIAALKRGQAADVALFGRMIADLPDINVEAAAQVAHALSTHKAEIEFDYFTAVDDRQMGDEPGAGMIGTIEYNSACFYRYANVDLTALAKNLEGDADTARRVLEAFVRAFVRAIPTGKQNSMAAHNPPSLVFAVAREYGQWSLANAFVRPVVPYEGDLVANSVLALDRYWGKLHGMYGADGITGAWCASLDGDTGLDALAEYTVPNLDALVSSVLTSANFAGNEVRA